MDLQYPIPVCPKAAALLAEYFLKSLGMQALISTKTGIKPASLSRMAGRRQPISLEQAMLIELASGGELRTEDLCPSRAELFAELTKSRFETSMPC